MQITIYFNLPNDPVNRTNILEHSIQVNDPTPITSKIYRFPQVRRTDVEKQVNKSSVSTYNSLYGL